ncbi:hypothetical protein [Hahella ganghwensis]|uniref:hypothetical protein n=1 Tax=Hahella ganghwensis TaxID=286420 RepID=UPI0003630F1A|nr:hypothetical protein [Hahella ganghwensis]
MNMKLRNSIAALICTVAFSASAAADLEITSDTVQRSQDGSNTVYTGNVILTTKTANNIEITSEQIDSQGDSQVFSGEVIISLDNQQVMTNKAIVTNTSEGIEINMDQATISTL